MAWYYTRQAAFTAATKSFGVLNTAVDGSTGGAIRIPQGASVISKITGAVTTDGGGTANSGLVFGIRITGAGLVDGQQDLIIASNGVRNGGGAITATTAKTALPTVIPTQIRVRPGNDVFLTGAYYGTDTGNQYVGVTLELS